MAPTLVVEFVDPTPEVSCAFPAVRGQVVDIPISRGEEEIEDMSVKLGSHVINDCIHSVKISKEKVAKLEVVTSSLRTRLQVLTKSLGSRQAARQAQNELDFCRRAVTRRAASSS